MYDPEEVLGYVEVREDVKRQLVDDIFCTAMEGGSNYWVKWCDKDHNGHITVEFWHEALSRGGVFYFHVYEEPYENQPGPFHLDLSKMLDGIKLYCIYHGSSVHALEQDHDANDADNIVQYAIFGEVIYG